MKPTIITDGVMPLAHAKKMTATWEERLRPYLVEVPKSWRRAALPTHRFPRACFSRAVYFVQESRHLPQALYVYGKTIGGGLGNHGWVEIEAVVFDGVMQQFYTKEGYYAAEMAIPWYRFTRGAVMFMARRMARDVNLTYRWDLHLPWATDPPLLVNLEYIKSCLLIDDSPIRVR